MGRVVYGRRLQDMRSRFLITYTITRRYLSLYITRSTGQRNVLLSLYCGHELFRRRCFG